MSIFEEILADIETKRNKKEFQEAHKLSIMTSLYLEQNKALFENKKYESFEHVFHKKRKKAYIEDIQSKSEIETINFGDSLSDLSREWLDDEIDGIYSIAGSHPCHAEQMAVELHPYFLNKKIKYITIGCLGGNPLMVYTDFDTVIQATLKCLRTIRNLYPSTRIIFYGIPPVYNIYAGTHSYLFDLKIFNEFIMQDQNAVFISLKPFGGGFLNLSPKIKWSNDGIHFTPRGALKFKEKIEKAKKLQLTNNLSLRNI